MKILVIQLARLGDIFQTWPTLYGLKREYPNAEIDFLVRDRFFSATEGCAVINEVIKFPTAKILSDIVLDENVDGSLKALNEFCSDIAHKGYDQVINLSFSPFSSYLVASISTATDVEIKGYTRYSDGYLCIPDDVSAYFYAQVGIDKANRVHLSQIFSGVAGIDLVAEDWSCQMATQNFNSTLEKFKLKESEYIILQAGASQIEKTYGADKWAQVLNHLSKVSDIKIVLVGAKDEESLIAEICLKSNNINIVELCGKTSISELFHLVYAAQLAVSGDSLLVHLASLANTRTLNVSMNTVNFWETGPLAKKSRIVFGDTRDDIASDRVAAEIESMLSDKMSGYPII
ncbi:MAG: glycosyltransferase family 9 protein, partial [Bdellovibrionales bacterium]|nr:glycosyltransferase family 9 protein [Bdellovibrionales bacterium]